MPGARGPPGSSRPRDRLPNHERGHDPAVGAAACGLGLRWAAPRDHIRGDRARCRRPRVLAGRLRVRMEVLSLLRPRLPGAFARDQEGDARLLGRRRRRGAGGDSRRPHRAPPARRVAARDAEAVAPGGSRRLGPRMRDRGGDVPEPALQARVPAPRAAVRDPAARALAHAADLRARLRGDPRVPVGVSRRARTGSARARDDDLGSRPPAGRHGIRPRRAGARGHARAAEHRRGARLAAADPGARGRGCDRARAIRLPADARRTRARPGGRRSPLLPQGRGRGRQERAVRRPGRSRRVAAVSVRQRAQESRATGNAPSAIPTSSAASGSDPRGTRAPRCRPWKPAS